MNGSHRHTQVQWPQAGEAAGTWEEWNPNWNELLGENGKPDPRRAFEMLERETPQNTSATEFWTIRWMQDTPALLAAALGIDSQGKLEKKSEKTQRFSETQSFLKHFPDPGFGIS